MYGLGVQMFFGFFKRLCTFVFWDWLSLAMLERAKLFSNVPAPRILVSSRSSYRLVIAIDPSLHKNLWDFIRTTCETEKKLSAFSLAREKKKAPRWSNMSFYLTVSRSRPRQPPLHQSSHSSRQYKCKSYNLERLCGLWLRSRLSVQNQAVKGHRLIKFGRLPRLEQGAEGDELTRLCTVKSNNIARPF